MAVPGRCHALCLRPYSGRASSLKGGASAAPSRRFRRFGGGPLRSPRRAGSGRAPRLVQGEGGGGLWEWRLRLLLVERCGGAGWCGCGGERVVAFRVDLRGGLLCRMEWLMRSFWAWLLSPIYDGGR